MANEITLNLQFSVRNGEFSRQIQAAQRTDQSAIGAHGPVVEVATSETSISFGDVSTPGYLYLKNLDDENYVTYGPDDSGMVAMGRLNPGECAILRADPGLSLVAQANTDPVLLEVLVLEN